jgi:membrane-bound lytic murein transglycosylase A
MPKAVTRTGNLQAFVRRSVFALTLVLAGCGREADLPPPPVEPPVDPAAAPVFEPVDWAAIEAWPQLDLAPAAQAFARSCRAITGLDGDAPLSDRAWPVGQRADWQAVCAAAEGRIDADFFEAHFLPVRVRYGDQATGLLTGYYEPEVEVRRQPAGEFTHPLRARPDDLISADLGAFSDDLAGHRIVGRVDGQRLIPYRTRSQIEQADSGETLAWGRPIDVFFLQIQGSGRLVFDDGETVRAAFAAHNGQPYASIGRELVARGELELHEASKSGIEGWLRDNGPEATAELFSVNPRYVFFGLERLADADLGPRGAAGLPLTPMGSVAVDPDFLPYGVPVLLSADLPDAPGWTGLVVTQDTGGAITGPLRGDLFYGWGDMAERRAGSTRSESAWIVLLPRPVAERLIQPA